ncbi:hypothetical protein AYI68_g3476 [Smittium mucronatum]|uniref:Uncharacterized protein n=1 Tax=Smittium mucronatum TaxID=133383 RepID=A0A1R0GZS6_9FUNG|nr:hypothetical protein AYI68_g3476 [Smittium mucronatum]
MNHTGGLLYENEILNRYHKDIKGIYKYRYKRNQSFVSNELLLGAVNKDIHNKPKDSHQITSQIDSQNLEISLPTFKEIASTGLINISNNYSENNGIDQEPENISFNEMGRHVKSDTHPNMYNNSQLKFYSKHSRVAEKIKEKKDFRLSIDFLTENEKE